MNVTKDKLPKILIVDDIEENLVAMTEALEDLDAELVTANSGQQALELLSNHEFAVVLLDVQMPEMNGFEAAELMRKNKRTRAVPIIFVTAISKEQQHVFKGYEAGAVDYLFKPINPHILCSKVQIFLDMYKQSAKEILNTVTNLRVVKSELKERNKELSHLALHDTLTSLSNRHQFELDLEKQTATALRHKNYRFAVIFLDLDNFKAINDTLGHQVGDELLKYVANLLGECIRQEDYLARLGGDEFAILITHVKHYTDAGRVASTIRDGLDDVIELGEHRLYTSFSIGIACYPYAGESANDLMRNADIAMYKAKKLGKNQIAYFTDDLQSEYAEKLKIETALREAIDNNELRLVYQPIFNLETKIPIGVEALLRWKHPELGEVAPSEFIPIAEDSGLIEKIGYWVIEAASEQFQKWFKAGFKNIFYAINLSPKQLQHSTLYEQVQHILSTHSFKPSNLMLELTENALINCKHGDSTLLEKLHKLGVQVILDDFGTGYSSLMKLRELPIYALKIDTSFIQKLGKDVHGEMITKAILSIAKNLKFKAIAEGIELEEQSSFLIDNHCRLGQGFLLNKPQCADQISILLGKYHGKA